MASFTREEKEQRWQEMAARVDRITDTLGRSVDEGIKETVLVLNLLAFRATQWCEGHAERDVRSPWVDMKPDGHKELERTHQLAVQEWDEARRQQKSKEAQEADYQKINEANVEALGPMIQLVERLIACLTAFYAKSSCPSALPSINVPQST